MDPRFDQITRLASALLGVPVSLVSLVDADRQLFAGMTGLPEPWASARQTPLSHSFCQHVVADGSPLVVTDARDVPRLRENRAIDELDVIAYLGVPLVTAEGLTLGSFCVIDAEPRTWTEEEIATVHDLAGLVRTELALLEAEHARRGAAESGELLASLAHDLRSIVMAVAGGARTLARHAELSEEHRRTVGGIVERQAAALEQLLTQLLDFGALRSGAVRVDTSPIDVGQLLGDVVGAYRLAGVAVDLAAELPGATSLLAKADELHLRRCLNNLVDNAHKHAGHDVTVTAGAVAVDGHVRLTVSDDGAGIEPADLDVLFDPRWRGPGSARGYGLGLHVVRSLVTAMGGTVEVASTVGGGTTFTITLDAA